MARLFLTSVDLNKNELKNAQIQLATTALAPTSPVQGQLYYDTTLKTLGYWETSGTPAWRYAAVSGQIVDADIKAAAGIAYSKLSLGTSIVAGDISATLKPSGTAAAGTEALRAIGTTSATALAGNSTLNSIASATATTANVAMSGFTFTGLAEPTGAQDAATKAYVDTSRTGLDAKASVRAASTAALTGVTYTAANGASSRGQITIAPNALDGVTLVAGDRLLIKNGVGAGSSAAGNGLWVVSTLGTGSNGVWDRATDFDADAEVTAGAYVWVEEGSVNLDSAWVLTTDNPITIGGASGTSLTWVLFSSSGSLVAGNGLTKTGNAIDVIGTTNRISVAADAVDISVNYVGQTSITTVGALAAGSLATGFTAVGIAQGGTGATTAAAALTALGGTSKYSVNNLSSNSSFSSPTVTWTVTHNLGTKDVHVQMRQVSDDQVVEPTIVVTSTTVATLTWNASALPADNTYRVVVIG